MTNEEVIINIQTGEESRKPLSKKVLDFHAKVNAEGEAMLAEAEARATARAAILDRLGLTTEEAAILLG